MSKGNKPSKNDKANMKPKKIKEKEVSDLGTSRLSEIFNPSHKKVLI